MARFYLPASEWAAPSWELRGDEAHHAAKVLRLKQGDSCVVFDGCGRAAHAVVAEPPRSSGVLLAPGEECPPAPELAHLTLCQAVPPPLRQLLPQAGQLRRGRFKRVQAHRGRQGMSQPYHTA